MAIIREAALVSKIHHPNIVFVNTTFIRDDSLYIEYDFIDGLPLSEFISGFARIRFKEQVILEPRTQANLPPIHRYYVFACLIILQALNGLRAAYEELDYETGEPLRIIHRDICPSNILVSRYGLVKITDFGLAFKKDFDIKDGLVIGKLAYCSPEQLEGKGEGYNQEKGFIKQSSDIFSLGVIFYELLTQKNLFPQEEMNLAMKKIHSRKGFIALRRHLIDHLNFDPTHEDKGIPKVLSSVIEKALNKDSKKRYQSYQDMIEDISNFMHTLDNRISLWNLKVDMEKILGKNVVPFEKTNTTVLLNK